MYNNNDGVEKANDDIVGVILQQDIKLDLVKLFADGGIVSHLKIRYIFRELPQKSLPQR